MPSTLERRLNTHKPTESRGSWTRKDSNSSAVIVLERRNHVSSFLTSELQNVRAACPEIWTAPLAQRCPLFPSLTSYGKGAGKYLFPFICMQLEAFIQGFTQSKTDPWLGPWMVPFCSRVTSVPPPLSHAAAPKGNNSPPENWSVEEVGAWLTSHHLEDLKSYFQGVCLFYFFCFVVVVLWAIFNLSCVPVNEINGEKLRDLKALTIARFPPILKIQFLDSLASLFPPRPVEEDSSPSEP